MSNKKYWVTWTSSEHCGYEEYACFNTEEELIAWRDSLGDLFTVDVIYGEKVTFIPKEVVKTWKVC